MFPPVIHKSKSGAFTTPYAEEAVACINNVHTFIHICIIYTSDCKQSFFATEETLSAQRLLITKQCISSGT